MQEFSRCPSCGCAVDDHLRGHHSAADCSILKYAERKATEAKAEERREAAERVRKEMRASVGSSNTIDRICSAILADQAPEAGKVEGPQEGDIVQEIGPDKMPLGEPIIWADHYRVSTTCSVIVLMRRSEYDRKIQVV